MIDIKQIGTNIKTIKRIASNIWMVICILELVFYPNFDTLAALCFSTAGLLLCGRMVFTVRNLLYYPVSTIAILMYPFFFMFLPPPQHL